MDYKKLYKEALERARELYSQHWVEWSDKDIENIFPELKESEDGQIRQEIVSAINIYCSEYHRGTKVRNDMLAWVEKQGEQKPADVEEPNFFDDFRQTDSEVEPKFKIGDKIRRKETRSFDKDMQVARIEKDYYICNHIGKFSSEVVPFSKESSYELVEKKPTDKVGPRFKVGDWIVTDKNHIWLIDEDCSTTGYSYRLISQNGKVEIGDYNIVDEHARLWTIQDAKDGDILATDDGICIFDGTVEEGKYPFAYCGITERGFGSYDVKLPFSHDNNVHPATKEQRDTLFAKMEESGYKWNADKKELKKIDNEEVNGEDYGIDGLWHAQRILEKTLGEVDGYQTDDAFVEGMAFAKNELEKQKPAWSEEDEGFLNLLFAIFTNEHPNGVFTTDNITVFKGNCVTSNRIVTWLKSLKDRVTDMD